MPRLRPIDDRIREAAERLQTLRDKKRIQELQARLKKGRKPRKKRRGGLT